MELEDIVIDNCGTASWGTCRLTGIDFRLADGSQLVVTNNDHTKPGLYVTEGGQLDASNAEVYVNHDAGTGLSIDSSADIGYYGHHNNDGGALGSTSRLNLGEREQVEVTDIDGVPTADEVGTWTNDNGDDGGDTVSDGDGGADTVSDGGAVDNSDGGGADDNSGSDGGADDNSNSDGGATDVSDDGIDDDVDETGDLDIDKVREWAKEYADNTD